MKIPDTQANVGAYYGNEENGQWQPNGVMIDSGVGGGIVGSGDAGMHRPPVYPVQIPRAHIPGYVVTGAYYGHGYPPPAAPDDFSDYMWMENEEEFEKEVMQQLEEEALMEQCIEAMLEDEQRERQRPRNGHSAHLATTSNGASLQETVSRSTLNPLAKEFVPTRVIPTVIPTQPHIESKPCEPSPSPRAAPSPPTPPTQPAADSTATTEAPPPPAPEVSAALLCDDSEGKHKPEVKKPAKQEAKTKTKVQPAKSETKVAPKKKEAKAVKSETKVEESEDVAAPVVEVKQTSPAPVEEVPSGPKPINYAAAAKANKPKPRPAAGAPPAERTPPAPLKDKKPEKKAPAKKTTPTTKPVQRKNSTK